MACWKEGKKLKFHRSQLLIYAVTDRAWSEDTGLVSQVEEALKGGATMIQLREKELDGKRMELFFREAMEIRQLTQRYKVPLIIDDNLELALKCQADGLHVGQNDMDAALARRLLGPERILGVTAKTVEQAKKAQADGADYLGSGAVFGTLTKSDAKPMSREMLQAICASVSIPVVAIGGICLDNISRLAGTGAAGAAIVSGIFAAKDIEGTTRQLKARMEEALQA
jgi:thiamine-phosphate pyrophosphorylase